MLSESKNISNRQWMGRIFKSWTDSILTWNVEGIKSSLMTELGYELSSGHIRCNIWLGVIGKSSVRGKSGAHDAARRMQIRCQIKDSVDVQYTWIKRCLLRSVSTPSVRVIHSSSVTWYLTCLLSYDNRHDAACNEIGDLL